MLISLKCYENNISPWNCTKNQVSDNFQVQFHTIWKIIQEMGGYWFFFNQNMTFQMFTVLRKKLINVFFGYSTIC